MIYRIRHASAGGVTGMVTVTMTTRAENVAGSRMCSPHTVRARVASRDQARKTDVKGGRIRRRVVVGGRKGAYGTIPAVFEYYNAKFVPRGWKGRLRFRPL